jgi:hypothetical protein
VIKFTSILSRCEAAELNQMDAAELLGIEERIFRDCQEFRVWAAG